jgi:hypothetical protein
MKADLSKIDRVVVLLKNGDSVRIYPQSISIFNGTTLSIQEKGAKL